MTLEQRVRAALRAVPDYPKPGILFHDITPLLANGPLFRDVIGALAAPFAGERISHVAGIEARGFIFAAPVATQLGAGFVPLRKPGKLPAERVRETYALEYGTDSLEIHADAVRAGDRVLLVDDVLATGGTAAAAVALLRRLGAEVVATSFLMEITGLNGRARLDGRAQVLLGV